MKEVQDQKRFIERAVADLENGCNVTIVAFGDSITAGYAVRHGFTYFWKERLFGKYPQAGIKIINSGTCGDTTTDGLARLDWDVLCHEPDLVTINFGTNDAVMGVSRLEFKANLKQMAKRIRAGPGSEMLLLSAPPQETPYYDDLVQSYRQATAEAAEEMETGLVDVYMAFMDRVRQGVSLSSLLLPGLDHPSEEGYRIIAEELMKLF
jgi:lysophospholipase L1-like esterase